MKFLIGLIIIILFVLGSFLEMGGNIAALLQPSEMFIILGSSIGSLIIASPKHILIAIITHLKYLFKPLPNNNKSYNELLLFLFNIFKQIKSRGIFSVERSLDAPQESELFTKYPSIIENKQALEFFCDHMRILSMGFKDHKQLEERMEEELEMRYEEATNITGAISNLGDAMPALGIVAAVLGVINTMAQLGSDPEVLGHSIGGALVGTFLGVLLAYAFVNPIGQYIEKYHQSYLEYVQCIKTAIIAHMKGNPPIISAEFARKIIPENYRPSFEKFETLINGAK